MFDSALAYMDKAYSLYNIISDSSYITKILSNQGSIAYYAGNYAVAEEKFSSALKYSQKLSKNEIATIHLNLSMIYNVQGNYPKSLQNLFSGLKQVGTDTLSIMSAKLYNGIGSLYLHTQEFQKSRGFLTKALRIFTSNGKRRETAEVHNNLANLCYEQKMFNEALEHYNQALSTYSQLSDSRSTATCLNNIGQIYKDQREYPKAIDYLNKSIAIRKRYNDRRGLLFTKLTITEIYYEQRNYEQACRNAEEVLHLATDIGLQREVCAALQLLAESNHKLGNVANAYMYMEQYSNAKDSLFSIEKAKTIADISTQYEVEKKEQQLHLQEQEIAILTREKSIKALSFKIVVLSITILLLIALFIALRLHTKNRSSQEIIKKNQQLLETNQKLNEAKLRMSAIEQEKLQDTINYNNLTMKSLALQTIQKNDFISALKKEIEAIEKSLPDKDSAKQFKQLYNIIKVQSQLYQDKESLQNGINRFGQDFLEKLSQQYPDLTEDEKRLCMYLKLNLSSKEISTLFGISPKSVDMKRFRLRKKVDVDSNTSLTKFLKDS